MPLHRWQHPQPLDAVRSHPGGVRRVVLGDQPPALVRRDGGGGPHRRAVVEAQHPHPLDLDAPHAAVLPRTGPVSR